MSLEPLKTLTRHSATASDTQTQARVWPSRAAFLVVAGLDVLAAAASTLLWLRTRAIYQREYLLVRLLCADAVHDPEPARHRAGIITLTLDLTLTLTWSLIFTLILDPYTRTQQLDTILIATLAPAGHLVFTPGHSYGATPTEACAMRCTGIHKTGAHVRRVH